MKILTGRVLQNGLMAAFLLALLLTAIRLWPHPPLWQGLPQSSVYYDRHGALLRITLANDDRYRLWTPLEQVSPLAVRGLLLHEDRWFYYNPGFNPVSLMRGFWRSYVVGGKMQGGSTISMQLARMRWHLNTRTPGGKLLQVLRAVQLELSYSKHDILEAYLNYAPYGRNIESIGAASLIYFAKSPKDLTLPEALTLAVLPQSPSYRLEPKTGVLGAALTQARNRLFQRWQRVYPTDTSQQTLFRLPLALRQPEQVPISRRTLSNSCASRRSNWCSAIRASIPRWTPGCSGWSSGRSTRLSPATAAAASKTPRCCWWTAAIWGCVRWWDRRTITIGRSRGR